MPYIDMKIKINGHPRTVNSYITLKDLTTIMDINTARFALSVNNESITQQALDTFVLQEGDRVDYELRVTGIPQISPNFTF